VKEYCDDPWARCAQEKSRELDSTIELAKSYSIRRWHSSLRSSEAWCAWTKDEIPAFVRRSHHLRHRGMERMDQNGYVSGEDVFRMLRCTINTFERVVASAKYGRPRLCYGMGL